MNLIERYMLAVAFVFVLALSASASDVFNPAELSPVQRIEIGEDIVHYTFEVTVDTGPYGKIRLHRFVRETMPYQPIQTVEGLLLLPGGWATVMGNYGASISSQHARWDHSILVYLAQNNIDVWGMDFAWALVPADRRNFRFMKDWTIERDVRHTAAALSIVRTIRGFTGQGTEKLNLLGHSWGGNIGYAVLSEESQRPPRQRTVGAFIAMDTSVKYLTDSPFHDDACASADQLKALWDSGGYADDTGSILVYIAWLAEFDPEGPSDIIPGFSNYQTFLYVFSSPQDLWHLYGGYYDENGVPTGYRFTDPQFAIDGVLGFAPYFPVKESWEFYAFACDAIDVAALEHIDQIKVPILYVGAARGEGENGYYTLTLTGSEDISKFTVKLLPDDERENDFGHGDLIAANDAEDLVWKPILEWITTH